VDVYADWIDACDAVAKEQAAAKLASRPRPAVSAGGGSGGGRGGEGLGDDFIVDDELDAEGEFADDE
jgi:transcription elongation factor Elf1